MLFLTSITRAKFQRYLLQWEPRDYLQRENTKGPGIGTHSSSWEETITMELTILSFVFIVVDPWSSQVFSDLLYL